MPHPFRPLVSRLARRSAESRGIGRRGWLVAVLAVAVAVGVVTLGVLRISLTLPDARQEVERRLAHLLDGPVHVDGQAGFQLLPVPRATLRDVRILATRPADDPVALEIDQVDAEFDVVAALFGRIEVRRVTLLRPELLRADAVEPDTLPVPAPQPEAGGLRSVAAIAQAPETSRRLDDLLARFEGINEIRVRDGLLRLPGRPGGVSNANLTFLWPGDGEAAHLSGSYVWNGEPTEVELGLERPRPFLSGEPSRLNLALNAPSLAVLFAGTGAGGDQLQLDGQLQLSTPSLARTMRWLGERSLTLPDFGALALNTQLRVFGDRASLGALELNLGGNAARGALETALGAGGRPLISGTLAFAQVDLGAFGAALAPPPRTVLDLQRPLRTAVLRDLDLDLRLSAASASLDRLRLGELAAAVKVTDGRATFDVGDMAILDGRGQMRVSLDTAAATPLLSGSASLRGLNLAALGETMGSVLPLRSGTADLELALASPAANWGDIALRNRTEIAVRARNGVLAGLSPRILRAVGRQTLPTAAAGAEFRSATAQMVGTGGTLRLASSRIETADGAAMLEGRYDLRSATMDANGLFVPDPVEVSGGGDAFTPSQPIPFRIEGRWPSPEIAVGPSDGPT